MIVRTPRSLMSFYGLVIVVVLPTSLFAAETPDDITKRITQLIGILASRNSAPRIVDHKAWAEADFDKAYDKNLQVSVYLAMQALLAEEEAVLDLLVKHGDDKRYCLTVIEIEYDRNRTVGNICTQLFWAKVLPFRSELEIITKEQEWVYPRPKLSAKEWWQGKRTQGLAKIQVEAIDATIEFMEKADAKKAVPLTPDAERLEPREFERGRKENLRRLKAIRETIVSTGRPYLPKTCMSWAENSIGLPWSGQYRK